MNPYLSLALILAAAPAAAVDDILVRPENCVPLMTMQKRGCEVATIYSCPSIDGTIFRTEDYDAEGFDGVELSNEARDLVQYSDAENEFHVVGGEVHSSAPPAQVVATGKGRFEKDFDFYIFGLSKPGKMVVDIVSDAEPFVLDEVRFRRLVGSVTMTFPQPMPTFSGTSVNYFDPVTGVMFEGESKVGPFADDEEDIPNTPAAISLPGQAGFQATTPVYDCGQTSSRGGAQLGDFG